MKNIYDVIPENLETEVFQRLLENETVTIERIISKGHQSPASGWYDHDKNEWVMVLRGEAILLFADESSTKSSDNSSIKLKAGDFINIPAHKKHKVEWTAPDIETIWLAVHY